MEIEFSDVQRFCREREVELVLRCGPAANVISLAAEWDTYGDFFTVEAGDVEYIDCPGIMTVGDLALARDLRSVAELHAKWKPLVGRYSGTAFVMRSVDVSGWNEADPVAYAIVIANSIAFRRGPDWR